MFYVGLVLSIPPRPTAALPVRARLSVGLFGLAMAVLYFTCPTIGVSTAAISSVG